VGLSTLHRKLDQEGVIFRDIKDSLRRDLAIDRLTHSNASVAQIAGELGFAEPSAFHRAFKTWTGVRPGDYRQRSAADTGE
jgi:AraC-like DNA-binding protein